MKNAATNLWSYLTLNLAKTRDEDGQTLAEYGLIMAVIAVAIVIAALLAFRGAITTAFWSATNCLDGTCS